MRTPDQLDKDEPARLRQQALTWLRDDLKRARLQLKLGPSLAATGRGKLKLWLLDPELAPVREPKELAKLPEAERTEWQSFWSEVREVLGAKK